MTIYSCHRSRNILWKNYKEKQFNMSVESTLSDYVGVDIERDSEGNVHMTQPQLIQ
jgi:hypothetical protein